MNLIKLSRLAVIPLMVAIGAALSLSRCGGGEANLSISKPAADKVLLKPGGSEAVRFVEKHSDRTYEVRIEYSDGKTAHNQYRADQTLVEVTVYYPAPKGGTERQLQRHASYEVDGKTYVAYSEYYRNGKTARQGNQFGDKTIFEVYSFKSDGITVSRHQRFIYNDKWRTVFDQSYGQDGAVLASSVLEADNTLTTTTFDEKGVKTSERKEDGDGVTIKTAYFFADGKNIEKSVEQGPSAVTTTILRLDGTPVVKREVDDRSLAVTYYNSKGSKTLVQNFVVDQTPTADGGTIKHYRLTSVNQFNAKEELHEQITFAVDGVTPATVTVYRQPLGPGRVEKTFAEDGSLAKEVVYGADFQVASTTAHDPAENIREDIPALWTTLEPFEKPPLPTGKFGYSDYGEHRPFHCC